MVLRRYHRASGTYFMAVQARYVSVLPVLSLARGHLQQPPSGFEADLIHLERVHLELLSEKAPIGRKSRYRSPEYRTFKPALPWRSNSITLAHHLWPMTGERPLMPPGFCSTMANIGHGIPLPRLSALSMYFWLQLRAVCDQGTH
jgi:hypothetical protein